MEVTVARMPAARPSTAEPVIPRLPRPRRARLVRMAQRLHALARDATQAETLHALAVACEAETAFIAELDAPAAAWRVVMSACGAGALLDARQWSAEALPELARQLRRGGLASVAASDPSEDGALLAGAGLGRLTVVALDPSRTTVLGLCLAVEAPAPDAAERALLTLAAVRLGAERRADQTRAALARAEERLALTVHGAAAGWFEWDLEAGRIEWSPRLRALFGYEAADPPEGALWHDLVDPADLARVERAVSAHFDGSSDHFDETFRARRKDGSRFWAWTRFQAARGAAGQLKRAVGTVLDVSAQQRVEAELAAEHARMRTTLAAIADAVVSVDAAGRVDYLNPAAERLLGTTAALGQGKPVEQVIPLGATLGRALERCVLLGATLPLAEAPLASAAGAAVRFVAGTVAPLAARDEDGGAVVVFRDVSEARALRERLAHQASHDPLTGLINRRELDARLERAVAAAKRGGRVHAFLYLDLDQFKVLNDSCGHAAGDALLTKLGAALRAALPPAATVARLGGDEFGVLLPDCELARAAGIAEQLRQSVIALPFEWQGRAFRIGASIGAVAISAGSATAAEVLIAADAACYAAKDAGRDRVHASAVGDAELARRRREMDWVRRIDAMLAPPAAGAVERFQLLRQPIAPLRGAGLPHHELLLRHRDAQGALTAPEVFVPAAERYGLMPRLDRWVVGRTLAWLAAQPGIAGMYAVNLSGQALADRRFHGFVREALAEAGVQPERLCIEITETSAIADLDAAARFLRGLRGLGCRAALDDFGTGLASFTYLKRLPLDYVKVDGSFVRGAGVAGVDREVVRAVQAVAGALGVATVAECVEDQACLDQLRDLGVDYAQGWAVGRPEPLPGDPLSGLSPGTCIPSEILYKSTALDKGTGQP
jgi:diguanylate cyclase (GGDEF)-like protein/PAS domain S-box-containing protein